jgi:hypothetical protein
VNTADDVHLPMQEGMGWTMQQAERIRYRVIAATQDFHPLKMQVRQCPFQELTLSV